VSVCCSTPSAPAVAPAFPPRPSLTFRVMLLGPTPCRVIVGVGPEAVGKGPAQVKVKGSPSGSREPVPFSLTVAIHASPAKPVYGPPALASGGWFAMVVDTPRPPGSRIVPFAVPSRSATPPSVMVRCRTFGEPESTLHAKRGGAHTSVHTPLESTFQYCGGCGTGDGKVMLTSTVAPTS